MASKEGGRHRQQLAKHNDYISDRHINANSEDDLYENIPCDDASGYTGPCAGSEDDIYSFPAEVSRYSDTDADDIYENQEDIPKVKAYIPPLPAKSVSATLPPKAVKHPLPSKSDVAAPNRPPNFTHRKHQKKSITYKPGAEQEVNIGYHESQTAAPHVMPRATTQTGDDSELSFHRVTGSDSETEAHPVTRRHRDRHSRFRRTIAQSTSRMRGTAESIYGTLTDNKRKVCGNCTRLHLCVLSVVLFVVTLVMMAVTMLCVTGYCSSPAEPVHACVDEPCLFNGNCTIVSMENDTFVCDCISGRMGYICEFDVDECASEPCLNALTCQNRDDHYTCVCQPGFTGVICETDMDECLSAPCINDGTCMDLPNGYDCLCPSGYAGPQCEFYINPCNTDPCDNGICTDRDNLPFCHCQPGYTGTTCETEIDECQSQPCVNGNCTDAPNAYVCTCQQGFGGQQCDIYINPCEGVNPCHSGTCTDAGGSTQCICDPGYTGEHCETEINECNSAPCQNGGTCTDLVNDINCACHPDFSGFFCETDISLALEDLEPPLEQEGSFCFARGTPQKYMRYNGQASYQISILPKDKNVDSTDVSSVKLPGEQIYLFSMSASPMWGTGISYYLNTANNGFNIKSTAATTTTVIGKDIIYKATENTLYIHATGDVYDNITHLMTSFCGVSLQSTMDPVVAFFSYWPRSDTAPIVLTHSTALNSGRMKSATDFTIPKWGIYLFTYSAALAPGKSVQIQLRVNGQRYVGLTRHSTVHNNQDFISRTVLLELRANDNVELFLASGATSASSYKETSWSGFLYSPKGPRQAWSVYRSTPWDAAVVQCSETLIFDGVLANEGNAYNKTTGEVIIGASGVYYLSVNIGASGGKALAVQIHVRGTNYGTLGRFGGWHNGQDALSRSIMLRLAAGDTVTVFADAGASNHFYIWGDPDYKPTAFIGLLMYE